MQIAANFGTRASAPRLLRPRSMKTARTFAALVFVGAVPITMVGCSSPFREASNAFATTTKASVEAVEPMFGSAAGVCRKRARLTYLLNRQTGREEPWSKWFEAHRLDKKTWKQSCDELTVSDAILEDACRALVAYAKSVQAVAKAADYDGTDITKLANDASSLGVKLAGTSVPTDSQQPLIDALAGLGSPLSTLAKGAMQLYADRDLKKETKTTAPVIRAILAAMKKYVVATQASVNDASKLLANVLDTGDGLLRPDQITLPDGGVGPGATTDPLRIFAFNDAATRYESELAATKAEWQAYGDAIDGLAAANEKLLEAANEKISDKEAFLSVVDFSTDTLTQVAKIKAAFAKKKDD